MKYVQLDLEVKFLNNFFLPLAYNNIVYQLEVPITGSSPS